MVVGHLTALVLSATQDIFFLGDVTLIQLIPLWKQELVVVTQGSPNSFALLLLQEMMVPDYFDLWKGRVCYNGLF